jgi:hypothetical protein
MPTPAIHRAFLLAAASLAFATVGPFATAEVPNRPATMLHQEPVQLEVTVLSIEEKPGPGPQTTSVWHRVRIERVMSGEGLAPGDEIAVISKTYRVPPGAGGSRGMRGDFRGPNGLPVKGDRARLFGKGTREAFQPAFPNGWQPAAPLVAFVAADDEYRSEITLPFLAGIAERTGVVRSSVSLASDPAKPETHDPNAKTGLTNADRSKWIEATVAYLRFERLDDRFLKAFLAPIEGGLPLVAFRTTTHAFAYPDGSPNMKWNAGFGERFLGTPWRFHHGHSSRTRILRPEGPPEGEAAAHPIVAGLEIPKDGLVVPSWLYHVEPLPADCRVLLWGEAVDSEAKDAPKRQPIVWVRELPRETTDKPAEPARPLPPQRIAVTTLGHPGDFASPEVRLLALRMIAWATGRELDAKATAEARKATFDPPPTR